MYFPMMMYPQDKAPTMPTPTKEGERMMFCMMPVFFDPSKMPKDSKFPNVPFPFCPYPMAFPQNNPSEDK